MMMGILSRFKPDQVWIEAAYLKSALTILEGLNRKHLQKASLSTGDPLSGPFGSEDRNPSIISLPLLSSLTLNGVRCGEHLDLLPQINAEALEFLYLHIHPVTARENMIVVKRKRKIAMPSFPCLCVITVHGLKWGKYLRDSFLPTLWEMCPNLTNLKFIKAYSSSSTLQGACKHILSSLNPVYVSALGKEVSPLPSLSLLDVNCRSQLFKTMAERDVEASRLIIVDTLVSRHKQGAVCLELIEFGYDAKTEVLNFRAVEINEVEVDGSMISPHR